MLSLVKDTSCFSGYNRSPEKQEGYVPGYNRPSGRQTGSEEWEKVKRMQSSLGRFVDWKEDVSLAEQIGTMLAGLHVGPSWGRYSVRGLTHDPGYFRPPGIEAVWELWKRSISSTVSSMLEILSFIDVFCW